MPAASFFDAQKREVYEPYRLESTVPFRVSCHVRLIGGKSGQLSRILHPVQVRNIPAKVLHFEPGPFLPCDWTTVLSWKTALLWRPVLSDKLCASYPRRVSPFLNGTMILYCRVELARIKMVEGYGGGTPLRRCACLDDAGGRAVLPFVTITALAGARKDLRPSYQRSGGMRRDRC